MASPPCRPSTWRRSPPPSWRRSLERPWLAVLRRCGCSSRGTNASPRTSSSAAGCTSLARSCRRSPTTCRETRRWRESSRTAPTPGATGDTTSRAGPRGTTCGPPPHSPRRPHSPSRSTSGERPTPYPRPPGSKEALFVADPDRSHEPQASPPDGPRVSRPRPHASRSHPHNRPRRRRLLRLCDLGQPRFCESAGRRLRRRHAGDKREDTEPGVLPRLLRRRPVPARGARCPLPRPRSGGFWLVTLACALYIGGGFLLTVFVNVPLNEQLARVGADVSAGELVRARAEYEGPWNFWNGVRAVSSTLAFLALVGACLRHGGRGTR